MVVRKLLRVYFFLILTMKSRGNTDNLTTFRQKQVQSIVRIGNVSREVEGGLFSLLKHEKFCEKARKKFSLPYIDEDYEPEVHEYRFKHENGEEYVGVAMECPTLPTVYLQAGKSVDEILVLSVKSVATAFRITTEIPLPITIATGKKGGLSDNSLFQLNHADRQNLCIEATSISRCLLIDNIVLKPHMYEFTYLNDRKLYVTIPCPTYPPTFFRLGSSSGELVLSWMRPTHTVEIVKGVRLLPDANCSGEEPKKNGELVSEELGQCGDRKAGSRVQEEFNNRRYLCSLDEADREKLCEIARDYINYTVQFPITTSEANFLEFDLGNGVKKKHWVIACSLEGDHFMYFANQAGEAGHTISVLLKSKLMEQCIDTEIVAP